MGECKFTCNFSLCIYCNALDYQLKRNMKRCRRSPPHAPHEADVVTSPSGGFSHVAYLEHVYEDIVMDAILSSCCSMDHQTPADSIVDKEIVADSAFLFAAMAKKYGHRNQVDSLITILSENVCDAFPVMRSIGSL